MQLTHVSSQETKLEEEKKRAEEAQTSKKKDSDELRSLKRAKEDMGNEMEELRETVSQVTYSPVLFVYLQPHLPRHIKENQHIIEVYVIDIQSKIRNLMQ